MHQPSNHKKRHKRGLKNERQIRIQNGSLGPFVLPFRTTAPLSPLVDLFIRSIASLRSLSVKNVVDSGRSGRRNRVAIPSTIGGIPWGKEMTGINHHSDEDSSTYLNDEQ